MQVGTVNIPVRRTRFAGLGFANMGRGCWRFIDLETEQVTGTIYASRDELLADLTAFASAMGYGES